MNVWPPHEPPEGLTEEELDEWVAGYEHDQERRMDEARLEEDDGA